MNDSLSVVADILYAPSRGFDRIKKYKTSSLIPLSICLLASALLLLIYYSYVNFDWLAENLYVGYSDQQRKLLVGILTKNIMILSAVGGVFCFTPILYAAMALYLSIATKLRGVASSFAECFRLVCWSALPGAILLPMGLVTIVLDNSGRLFPEQLDPTSLNSLIFHVSRPNPYLTILASFDLFLCWQVGLMAIGLRRFASISASSATAIVCAPYALIFGTWLMTIILVQSR